MWTFARPRPSRREVARLATTLALALAVLGALTAERARSAQAAPAFSHALAAGLALPRCYWIGPPVTRDTPLLLNSGFVNCTFSQCRATLRETTETGWVCFFPRPW